MEALHLLLVDDQQVVRDVIARELRLNNYRVQTAASGEEALEVTKAQKPDLVLMDVVMPGMSGFEATRAISKDPDTSHIPVIICSSKGQETDKAWGMRQGARDYLIKPIGEAELMSKIQGL